VKTFETSITREKNTWPNQDAIAEPLPRAENRTAVGGSLLTDRLVVHRSFTAVLINLEPTHTCHVTAPPVLRGQHRDHTALARSQRAERHPRPHWR